MRKRSFGRASRRGCGFFHTPFSFLPHRLHPVIFVSDPAFGEELVQVLGPEVQFQLLAEGRGGGLGQGVLPERGEKWQPGGFLHSSEQLPAGFRKAQHPQIGRGLGRGFPEGEFRAGKEQLPEDPPETGGRIAPGAAGFY